MQKLLRRIKNKNGFTLMEMLIVVAIIVILVAIAVPVFTSQLGEAKDAVDAANLRSAKSLALTMYMTGAEPFDANGTYYYNVEDGSFTDEPIDEGYGESSTYEDSVITAVVNDSGVTVAWTDAS